MAPSGKAETHPTSGEAGSRARLIGAAARLFQEKGYAATGLSEILSVAGTPKGSLYHHFPGGKAALGAAAMDAAGEAMAQSLIDCRARTRSSAEAIRAYGQLLAGWLEGSGFVRGCPVATVALEEAPGDSPVAQAARRALERAEQALGEMLTADGLTPALAERRAALGFAALEGALIQARLRRSSAPVIAAAEDIAELIEASAPG